MNNLECIILAAGFGKRMLPLTNLIPKPLIEINNKSLLQYHLDELYKINISKIVITNYWKGNKIKEKFKNIENKYKIIYSNEKEILGVGGGINKAIKNLETSDYFVVINGDIYIPNFNYKEFEDIINELHIENNKKINNDEILAFLYLVSNPDTNKKGDFYLDNGIIRYFDKDNNSNKYTFSGIAIYHINFFKNFPLPPFN